MPRIIPAIFSFFIVGLGQIIKGQSEKGLKFMLLIYFIIPMLLYLFFMIKAELFLLMLGFFTIFYLIFWVYNIMDAYRTS